MSPHCTNPKLSRRRFLQWLGAAAGLALPDLQRAPAASRPTAIWWQSLQNGKICLPPGLAVPSGMPGSIMKLVTAAALHEERLIAPDQDFECRGSLELENQRFYCQHAHGRLRMTEALGVSCNLFFAQAATELSAATWLRYARRFQLDQPCDTKSAGTFPGRIPLSGDHTRLLALGLHPALRPDAMQLMRLAALIGQRKIADLSDETYDILQNGMRHAALRGTGAGLDPENRWRPALKTGTIPHGTTYQSWLIGYFPSDNPKYAFCLHSPSGTARDTAVPLARQYLLSRRWP